MAAITPQVKGNTCTDPSKPLYPPMVVGSDFWFSWLREPDVKSFHFESEQGKFTARKEDRPTSTNEYWYAYRKLQGKLRKIYLGPMDELTEVRLSQVAAEISQPAQDYYYSRKSYLASLEQKSTATAGDSSLTVSANGYPTKEVISCVTDSSELEAMNAEAALLRSQLAVVTDELDQERADKNGWMDSALQWQSIADQVQEECQELRKSLAEVDLTPKPNGYPRKELVHCVTNRELELAADILRGALTLKANAGGAIKEKIREALSKLQQSQQENQNA